MITKVSLGLLCAALPLFACAQDMALNPFGANLPQMERNGAKDTKEFSTIYWSDGDSGRLDGLKFRLSNIDAPETGRMGQRGGAQCELEIQRGFEAKAFMVEFTRGAELRVTQDYGEDRYGRLIIDLEANGVDVAQAGLTAGYFKDWPHKSSRALIEKPNWCNVDY